MEQTLQEVKRTERGWGGHFVSSHHCEFRRNTLLECGEVKLVVSTVGANTPKQDGKYYPVNASGFYETLIFKADRAPYWDIFPSQQVSFDGKWCIETMQGTVDIEANDMHEAAVHEMTKKLQEGQKV
jgi:hypothetical protein